MRGEARARESILARVDQDTLGTAKIRALKVAARDGGIVEDRAVAVEPGQAALLNHAFGEAAMMQ